MRIWHHFAQSTLAISLLFFAPQIMAGTDLDADGVPNNADNCLLASNTSQADTDSDGYGNACDPDLNNDGIVSFPDVALFKSAFLTNPASANWNEDADFDGDSFIGFLDLAVMKALFLGPPGPVGQVRWVNPESGNWNEPTNWFPVGIPVAPNFALIDTPGIVVTHNDGNNYECSGVFSVADIVISDASSLTVFGDMDMQGNLTLIDANSTLRNARVIRTVATEGPGPLTVNTNVTLDNVTLGVDLSLANGLLVDFENGLTLDNSTLTFISDGSFTQARFDGTQTLGGTGEIHYAGTTAGDTLIRLFAQNNGDTLTIGSGITVRSQPAGGWLGTSSLGRGLNMLGTVIADDSGAEITVQGDAMTIDGTLTASGGGNMQVDGNWTASAGTTMTATGGSELELFGSWSSEATVSVIGGLLDIGNNNTSHNWTNLGTITVTGDAQVGGVFGPADIGNMTIGGITSLDGRIILTGLTFDLDTAPGTWQLTTNGVIQDGTVTGTLLDIVGQGDLDGTTLAVVDTVANNGVLVDVFNGLTLAGSSFTLVSNGSFTQMRFFGDQTLGGTGEILYGGTTAGDTLIRIYAVANGDVLTVGSGITARTLTTGGWLGTNAAGRGLTFLGRAIADVDGAELTVQGDQMTIDAVLLTASNGGTLTTDGVWTASDTTTMTATNGSELQLFGSWSSEADIDVTDGLLDIGDNNSSDSWTNLAPGSITLVNSDAELGGIFVPDDIGNTTIDGFTTLNGRLILTGSFNLDVAPGTWQLGTDGVFQDGTVTGTSMDIVGQGDLDGTTLAVNTTQNNATTVDVFNGLTLNSIYTMISNGSFTQMIYRGSQTLDGSGEILYGGTTAGDTLIRTYAAANGDVLTVGSGITVRTQPAGGWLGTNSLGRGLNMLGTVIADDAGAEITVQGDPLSIDGTLTGSNGADITVDGDWTASAATTMSMSGGGTLALLGTWSSEAAVTVTNSLLDIGDNATDPWTNLAPGSITLVNSDATFGGSFAQSDLGTITSNGNVTVDGLLDNTGETLNIDTLPGDWQLGTGTISGGTITGTTLEIVASNGELDGVTLSADMNLNNGVILDLTNGLTLNNVTVTLISNGSFTQLRADGTQTVGGTGLIQFSGTTTGDTLNRFIPLANGDTLTIGAGVTISADTTGGWVGSNSLGRGLTLEGTVNSGLSGHKVFIYGDVLAISGDAVATAGGDIQVSGDWTAAASATVSISGGGELELFGQWINSGAITVTDSLLDIGNNVTTDIWTNLGTIDLVNSDAELGGLFVFADLGTFASNGTVTVNGELDNTALTLDLDTVPGTWQLGAGGEIIGGTITGTSFLISGSGDLNGVTLSVDTTVANATVCTVTNGLTLLDNISVTIASDGSFTFLRFSGTQTLGGTGEILF
ncbi:MAG: hypothetical protein OEQ74_05325, partial [Gammaproteobacteria bacterium]|nr:hypothetical protein [Gammaproteobacteria bacterium]